MNSTPQLKDFLSKKVKYVNNEIELNGEKNVFEKIAQFLAIKEFQSAKLQLVNYEMFADLFDNDWYDLFWGDEVDYDVSPAGEDLIDLSCLSLGLANVSYIYDLQESVEMYLDDFREGDFFEHGQGDSNAIKYYLMTVVSFQMGGDLWGEWNYEKNKIRKQGSDGSLSIFSSEAVPFSREEKLLQTSLIIMSEPPLIWWPRCFFEDMDLDDDYHDEGFIDIF